MLDRLLSPAVKAIHIRNSYLKIIRFIHCQLPILQCECTRTLHQLAGSQKVPYTLNSELTTSHNI